MEWLSSLFNIGATAASGGILGIVGGLGSSVVKYFHQKQENKEKAAQHERDKELLQMKNDGAVTEKSWDAMITSQQADIGQTGTLASIATFIKTLYRIVLTSALIACVYWIFLDFLGAISGGEGSDLSKVFDPKELKDILRYIVNSITFTACTAAMWWFSERAFAPPGMKNR